MVGALTVLWQVLGCYRMLVTGIGAVAVIGQVDVVARIQVMGGVVAIAALQFTLIAPNLPVVNMLR